MRVLARSIVVGLGVGLLGASALSSAAAAAEPCERQALIRALGKLPGSAGLRVERADDRTALIDVATRTVVLEATCKALTIPLADGLQRPTRAPTTKADPRFTVAKTARGAVSLGIAAGVAAAQAIELVTFDDDSLTLTDDRGRTWYSVVTKADGTLVEVEGAHAGCGCERTTTSDGRVSERRL